MEHLEARQTAIARIGRALADPTRGRILLAILDGVHYPADLASELVLSRANVSNHLACLRGCGLVTTTPHGRQVRYELSSPALAHALGDLLGVVLAVEEDDDCAVPGGQTLAPAAAGASA